MKRRAERITTVTLSAGGLLALLVGVPVFLGAAVGWPLPSSLPGWSELADTARSNDIDGRWFRDGAAVVAWLAWAYFAGAVAVEVTATLRGRPARRLPIAAVQRLAARLLAGMVLATSLSSRPALAAPPTLPVVAGQVASSGQVVQPPEAPTHDTATPGPTEQHHADQHTARTAQGAAAPPLVAAPATPGEREGDALHYRVRTYDTFGRVAERFYGDERRWRDVRDFNVGRVMPDGTVIRPDTEAIRPGWTLALSTDGIDRDADGLLPPDREHAALPPTSPGPPTTVTVEEGDNMWTISEAALTEAAGRPVSDDETAPYWEDTIEANRGRLADPDNPSLIFPGQELDLPPAPPELTGTPPFPSPAEGDGVTPDSRLATPGSGGHAEPGAPTAPSAPQDTAGGRGRDDAATPERPGDNGDDTGADETVDAVESAPVGMLGVAGLVLAVGVRRSLRRRNVRRSVLHPGRAPAPPPSALDDLRASVARDADTDGYDRLLGALGELAAHRRTSPSDWRPRLVQLKGDTVEVLMAPPIADPPSGWSSEADGAVWRSTRPTTSSHSDTSALPALVPVGEETSSGQVLLDLEAEGVVAVVGDDVATRRFAAGTVAALSQAPGTSPLSVVVVGDLGDPALSRLDRVRVADRWDDVAASLLSWAKQTSGALDDGEWPTTFAARAFAPPHQDGLSPTVVVCVGTPTADTFAQLCRLARQGRTTVSVVVVGADLPDSTRIHVDGAGELTIPDLGLRCRAQVLDPDVTAAIADLLDDAARLPGPLAPPSDYDPDAAESDHHTASAEGHADTETGPVDADAAEPTTGQGAGTGDGGEDDDGALLARAAPEAIRLEAGERDTDDDVTSLAQSRETGGGDGLAVDDAPAVLVRLLGEITVDGPSPRPLIGKQTAVFAYVALHSPVSGDNVADAVWSAPTGSRRKRLVNTASECRSLLGGEALPLATNSRYRVGPGVATDLDLFDRRTHAAEDLPAETAIPLLRSALELVRGPVFTYLSIDRSSYVWIDVENWVPTWELRVVDTACALAELCMAAGDFDGALWAAHQGLLAAPTDSQLTEAAMAAYAARGDRRAAEQVYRSHVAALEDLEIDEVADSTVALYEAIRGGTWGLDRG